VAYEKMDIIRETNHFSIALDALLLVFRIQSMPKNVSHLFS